MSAQDKPQLAPVFQVAEEFMGYPSRKDHLKLAICQ